MQITNVNDLQEGDVMELGGRRKGVMTWGKEFVLYAGHSKHDWRVTPEEIQDLMNHGIPFERREK